MRVVVTGATGLVGREIVGQLADLEGVRVVATTRDPERRSFRHVRIEWVQAFAGDALSLARAFTRADVVVHAVQFPNHPVEDPARGWTYAEFDGHGTRTAVRAARACGVRRFVYLSGAGAGQGRPQPWFQAKERAESSLRESGLEFVSLRPSWIYGPRDRSLNRFVAFCRWLPLVPVIGDGRTPVFPVHVTDVARCAVDAALREDAKALALEIGGPQRMTMDEVIRTLLRVMGKRRPILHHPAGFMKLAAAGMQLLPSPLLSPGAIDFLLQEVEIDPKPAMDYFGFRFRTLEEGLREYLP
jgi:NADH dehydrogenase